MTLNLQSFFEMTLISTTHGKSLILDCVCKNYFPQKIHLNWKDLIDISLGKITCKNSRPEMQEMLCKQLFPKNFVNFLVKLLFQSLFYKVAFCISQFQIQIRYTKNLHFLIIWLLFDLIKQNCFLWKLHTCSETIIRCGGLLPG